MLTYVTRHKLFCLSQPIPENIIITRLKVIIWILCVFQSDYIYYVHNGSDTLTDNFAIMAKSGRSNKKSNPHTIQIEIIPTNDQPPRVVVNKPLHVWTGEEFQCVFLDKNEKLSCKIL